LNGQPREVTVRDVALRATVQARLKADPLSRGRLIAIPGGSPALLCGLGGSSEESARDRLLSRKKRDRRLANSG